MKGLILAAGRGTRLRPLTDKRSKPLVTLANRPLIHYAIDKLVDVGVNEIGIVVGDNADELRRHLAYPGPSFTFIHQPEPHGLAHAVSFAREFTGSDDFILLFCDNLFSASLHASLQEWRHLGRPRECLIHVHEIDDPRACGVAVVADGWVSQLEEKPLEPKSNLAIAGVYFFTPRIYEAIAAISPSARGELEITDAIGGLIAMGHGVRAREIGGYWFDTGTFGDLITAQSHVMDEEHYTVGVAPLKSRVQGNVDLPTDCVIENSTLEGPSVVGSGARILGSRVGPNVAIGKDCVIVNSELSDCQVYPGTSLHDVQARGAIFDGDVRIDVT